MTDVNDTNVTMQDGTTRNFGERGRLLSTHTVTDTSLNITFHIVTGEQVTFSHKVSGLDEITAEAAVYGFSTKAKSATAGVAIENIKKTLEAKIEEFKKGVWATRGSVGQSLSPLTQIQTAYAIVHEIDITKDSGIAEVNAAFASLTKEDRSALYQDKEIKKALAKLRYEAAQAL